MNIPDKKLLYPSDIHRSSNIFVSIIFWNCFSLSLAFLSLHSSMCMLYDVTKRWGIKFITESGNRWKTVEFFANIILNPLCEKNSAPLACGYSTSPIFFILFMQTLSITHGDGKIIMRHEIWLILSVRKRQIKKKKRGGKKKHVEWFSDASSYAVKAYRAHCILTIRFRQNRFRGQQRSRHRPSYRIISDVGILASREDCRRASCQRR